MNSKDKPGTRILVLVLLLGVLAVHGASANPSQTMDPAMHHRNGTEIAVPMISGYDPVAYFAAGRPVRGNGYHTATHQGGTYLFANKDNQKKFEANPGKYAPQYGGYCAYGVSVGKKFYTDPNRWKIVEGKLYLNLDAGIQKKWNEDISGNITKADSHWVNIEHKDPSEL
ncbi:MAG: YHS domain-containing (seleno)protein [Anaerolineae bacterium]